MRRLAQIDALRGIAAAAVVLYHYMGMRPGADGVFLFFVISGFVILVSIETKADFTSFAWARFVRLYPVYWASMALTIVAMLLWGEAGMLNPARLLANISMVPVLPRQFLAHTRTADWFRLADIDDSYWTLIYELVFYLLAGVTCLVARIRRPEWPCLVWIAASALVRLAPQLGEPWGVVPLIATRFTECFVVGITIYLSYRGRADRLTWLVLAGAMLLSLIDDHGRSSGHFPFTLATSGLAVWLAARGRLWPLLLQPFPFLGRISYALYLVHQMIGRIVGDALRLHGVSQGASLALRVATALILAAALTFLVERPAHDALIGLVGRRRIPGEVSSA